MSPLTVRTRSRMLLVEIFFFWGVVFLPLLLCTIFFSPFARLILHIQAEIGVLD